MPVSSKTKVKMCANVAICIISKQTPMITEHCSDYCEFLIIIFFFLSRNRDGSRKNMIAPEIWCFQNAEGSEKHFGPKNALKSVLVNFWPFLCSVITKVVFRRKKKNVYIFIKKKIIIIMITFKK